MVSKKISEAKGSKGIYSGLNLNDEEEKDVPSKEVKKENTKEAKIKRSYALPETTIRKLSELKIYHYPTGTSLEDIVNDAILNLYNLKNSKEV